VFGKAVRVPRHAFSPNCTGALGTPLDFLVKLGLRFYLEVLVFGLNERDMNASKAILLRVRVICNLCSYERIAYFHFLRKYDFGVLAGRFSDIA
jgi:hypothetical protein